MNAPQAETLERLNSTPSGVADNSAPTLPGGEPQSSVAPMAPASGRRGIVGYFLLGTAFLLCPCHLPILLIILGGTALGSFLTANTGLIIGASIGYVILAVIFGLKFLNHKERTSV